MPVSAFDDVTLEWGGQPYVIKADRRMEAIARIEEFVTFAELQRYWDRKTAPTARLAMAFASLLRHAGAKVTDADVYMGMFPGGGSDPTSVTEAITTLIAMMVPPSLLEQKVASPGKASPAASVAGASSKRRTSSRSANSK